MFIKLTQTERPDIKVRIAIDKIIFYMANPEEPTGSILATIDGQPCSMIESVEQIDSLIYLAINPETDFGGPR